jgi:hypothetical protein
MYQYHVIQFHEEALSLNETDKEVQNLVKCSDRNGLKNEVTIGEELRKVCNESVKSIRRTRIIRNTTMEVVWDVTSRKHFSTSRTLTVPSPSRTKQSKKSTWTRSAADRFAPPPPLPTCLALECSTFNIAYILWVLHT